MKSITPFSDLNTVLQIFVDNIGRILGGNLIGVYLQGSFATGDFDEHSDCDFIVVIESELSDREVADLQTMHQRLFDIGIEWARHLEGSYFPKDILRNYAHTNLELWYLDNGHSQLIKAKHCNTAVVRWTLREHGVILQGPQPFDLIDAIPTKTLQNEILNVMHDWGNEIFDNPEQFSNRFYQSFIVLSYCRMLHDLRSGTIGSKRTGAEWAKGFLDQSWADLIDRTWAARPNPAVTIRQPADARDFQRTLEFIKVIINKADEYAAETAISSYQSS